MTGEAVRVMNEVREAYGVVIPPFCRCAAAALLANCGAPAPRREERRMRVKGCVGSLRPSASDYT